MVSKKVVSMIRSLPDVALAKRLFSALTLAVVILPHTSWLAVGIIWVGFSFALALTIRGLVHAFADESLGLSWLTVGMVGGCAVLVSYWFFCHLVGWIS